MENIYKYSSSDQVNIKAELDAFREELKLHEDKPLPATDADVKNLLGITNPKTYKDLKKSVDLEELLNQKDDVRVNPFKPTQSKTQNRKPIVEIPKQALYLNTFREVIKFKKKFTGSPFGRTPYAYCYTDVTNSSDQQQQSALLKPFDDVLISIRFYRPFRSIQRGQHAIPRFAEEFVVRGDQYLSELRDRVSCECIRPCYDVSANPEQQLPELKTNPGFFFITDTFYNDRRNPENPDYSEVIMKWAATRRLGTFSAEFKQARMEETRFRDINVRLGYPQVYQHFGNCEHVFVFSWIQLISPKEHLLGADYPLLRSCDFASTPLCNVCGDREYSFVVTNSDRHVHDPVYLCRICFNSYHYVDGEKIGNFKAYHMNFIPPEGEVLMISSEEDEDSSSIRMDAVAGDDVEEV